MIRTLVADDEPIAREGLRRLLADEKRFAIIGESANGRDAVERIRRLSPQLVLLDVQMPDLDGFGVLRALSRAELPVVVFVTAYDRYALEAFEASAVDYLLKPFDRPRLRRALERAERFIGHEGEWRERAGTLLVPPGDRRVLVRDRDRITFVNIEDVAWVESEGNYLNVCAAGRVHLVREALRTFARRLDPARFLRVSRSVVVNLDQVRELRRLGDGRYRFLMRSGHQLSSSRRYRRRVRELVEGR